MIYICVHAEFLTTSLDLPEGEPRKKANALMPEISAKWASMTDEEKKASTEDKLSELRETREMRKLASHNIPINSFHDAHATFDMLDEEVREILI